MSAATYFVQSCPTCGRRLQVRIEYLGKEVMCQHCRAHFHASDSSMPAAAAETGALLERVDQLLAESSIPRLRPQ